MESAHRETKGHLHPHIPLPFPVKLVHKYHKATNDSNSNKLVHFLITLFNLLTINKRCLMNRLSSPKDPPRV